MIWTLDQSHGLPGGQTFGKKTWRILPNSVKSLASLRVRNSVLQTHLSWTGRYRHRTGHSLDSVTCLMITGRRLVAGIAWAEAVTETLAGIEILTQIPHATEIQNRRDRATETVHRVTEPIKTVALAVTEPRATEAHLLAVRVVQQVRALMWACPADLAHLPVRAVVLPAMTFPVLGRQAVVRAVMMMVALHHHRAAVAQKTTARPAVGQTVTVHRAGHRTMIAQSPAVGHRQRNCSHRHLLAVPVLVARRQRHQRTGGHGVTMRQTQMRTKRIESFRLPGVKIRTGLTS
jgi:hypothetical protein